VTKQLPFLRNRLAARAVMAALQYLEVFHNPLQVLLQ
jgi:hypothetical protein